MSRKLAISIAVAFLVLVTLLLEMLDEEVELEKNSQPTELPKVSIITTKQGIHRGTINALAELKPRWMTTIKSQVNGLVTDLPIGSLAGNEVVEGQILLAVEDSEYQASLSEAKRSLAEAKLALTQQQRRAKQAREDWKISGIELPADDIALRRPQLDIAKQSVTSALHQVEASQQLLNFTKVQAPFNGVISQRYVSVGEVVNQGDPLFEIIGTGQLDIAALLEPNQRQYLAEDLMDLPVAVFDSEKRPLAQARVNQAGYFLDPKTRQYPIFLEVDNSAGQLLSNQFVWLGFPSKGLDNTLLVPESAYTRDGVIWYVDDQQTLRSFNSRVLLYQDHNLIVSVPAEHAARSDFKIVVNPLAYFVAGAKVIPVEGAQ